MSQPTPAEQAYIERLGLFFELAGASRMVGRLLAWLLICDPPHQSITELATALGVSKASVSTVIRQMQQGQMVERLPVAGSRQHHYQLKSGGWTRMVQARLAITSVGVDALKEGLAAVGDDPSRRERLEEVLDFFEFMTTAFGEDLLRRWEKYRDERRRERHG